MQTDPPPRTTEMRFLRPRSLLDKMDEIDVFILILIHALRWNSTPRRATRSLTRSWSLLASQHASTSSSYFCCSSCGTPSIFFLSGLPPSSSASGSLLVPPRRRGPLEGPCACLRGAATSPTGETNAASTKSFRPATHFFTPIVHFAESVTKSPLQPLLGPFSSNEARKLTPDFPLFTGSLSHSLSLPARAIRPGGDGGVNNM
eukprot:GHVU01232271.1.p1 GENE.GHVU01232271.1~~GHVU01232271.1.p1  ORF type:complete len:203 (-),score=6.45 GHVU01232271.1:1159-1767(-)